MTSRPGVFQFGTFLLNESPDVCWPFDLVQILAILFFILLINLAFQLCSFFSHILLQKSFVSFAINCSFCLYAFSIDLPVEFSFIILKGPVLHLLVGSVFVSFQSFFYCQYFLVYFFQLYIQSCLLLSFFNLFIQLGRCVFFLP